MRVAVSLVLALLVSAALAGSVDFLQQVRVSAVACEIRA
jgi:hypothetical protein